MGDISELTGQVDTLIDVKSQRDALKIKDKMLLKQQTKAESEISSLMLINDMTKMSRKGKDGREYTVYTRRELSVKSLGGNTAAIVSALRKISGELIGISHPKLKAYVKEKMPGLLPVATIYAASARAKKYALSRHAR